MSVVEPVITMSETVTKIVPALLLAKKNMGPLIKNAVNPHFNNRYANLEASLDVVDPALQAQGILMLQGPGGNGEVISLDTTLIHESGEWIRSVLTMKPAKQANPQDAGSVITYARRYSIQGLFALAAEDDDANAGSGKGKKADKPAASVTTIGIDPNALLLHAVDLGFIPDADRVKFKAWARERVAHCGDIADKAPLTAAHLGAIKAFLDEAEAIGL